MVALADRLSDDLKQAMKSRDAVRVSVLRMVKAAAKNAEIEAGRVLTDDELLGVMRREVKQRKDALEAFQGSGRDDLIAGAESELAVLQEYLPEPLSEEELRSVIRGVVADLGARSRADVGKVIPAVLRLVGARADGKAVSRLVQEILGGL